MANRNFYFGILIFFETEEGRKHILKAKLLRH
jgi:hypothetical protein